MKLLCVGDIHLGKLPSRLPADLLRALGRTPEELGPAGAWRRAVEHALEESVDAVLLAGDVVESEEDFYEAYPLLERGVRELVQRGIAVVAVAGNHDVKVLPRLAAELPGFTLLGRGGRWQSHVIEREATPLARVVGWSFPEREFRDSPLASFPSNWEAGLFDDHAPDELPTLGLLHADLDASANSKHAPVRRAELAARPLVAWLVGHVHAPDAAGLAAERPLGYLGSLAATDPGEPGPHGPWTATLERGRLRAIQRPLAPVRWERLELFADRLADVDELDSALLRSVEALHARLAPDLGGALAVGLRVRLTGASSLPRRALEERLERALSSADGGGLRRELEGVHYFVEHVEDATRPDLPLAELARKSDPAGLVARRILALEGRDDEGRRLVREAQEALRSSRRLQHRNFQALGPLELEDDRVRELLLRAARTALEELLAQRAGAGEPAPAEELSA